MTTSSHSEGDLIMGAVIGAVLTVACAFYLFIALSNMNFI